MKDKKFLFLYPIDKIFDFEISNYTWSHGEGFRKKYITLLNRCIEQRYRQNGFQINYLVFDDTPVSAVILQKPEDVKIKAGITAEEHFELKIYPDEKGIIERIMPAKRLVIAGFHLWDCVDKAAESAYRRGIDVEVDEDLTETFPGMINNTLCRRFRTDRYPNYFPRGSEKRAFFEARREKPWMRQH